MDSEISEEQPISRPVKSYTYDSQEDVDKITSIQVPEKVISVFMVTCSLIAGSFLAALDSTCVSTLLTVIASDFNELHNASWIGTSYLLSYCAFQPLFGKLSDIFGRKEIMLFCNSSFVIGCLISGIGKTFWHVIFGRFVTGIGGGGMISLCSITLTDIFPIRKRGIYQGLVNCFFGLGHSSGGIIGGLMSDLFGWRAIFYVQVPFCLVIALMVYQHLNISIQKEETVSKNLRQKIASIDFGGSLSIIFFLSSLTIITASKISYPLILLPVFSFCTFIYFELTVEVPMLPIRLLRKRTVLATSFQVFFMIIGVYSYLYYVPFWFSLVMHMKPTDIGVRLFPNLFGISLGSLLAGYYIKKYGKYKSLNNFITLIPVLGSLRLCFINPHISSLNQYTLICIPGFGISAMLTIALMALLGSIKRNEQSAGVSIQFAFRSIGSAMGVVFGSMIFQMTAKTLLLSKLPSIAPYGTPQSVIDEIISKAIDDSNYVYSAPEWSTKPIIHAYNRGCIYTFYFSFIVISMGYLCGLFSKDEPFKDDET